MQNASAHVWNQCLELVKEKVTPQSYLTWINPIKAVELNGTELTLEVPSDFFSEWLEDNYSKLLNNTIRNVLGDAASIRFAVVSNGEPEAIPEEPPRVRRAPEKESAANGASQHTNQLMESHFFENFVEGSSNQFAKAAAQAVSEAPGKTSFNPLVIYGGVGLGKTHLIHAIGNHALQLGTAKNVVYVSSEKFTIEFINSIQNNKTTEFSQSYRNADLLLVDDIQFFINKERTQEEFFHTFNSLHQNGKQIVLSSDRPPKDITGIEERLLSRFQWGLVADIQPPDLETRIAILQQKAEENAIDLPADVVQLMAYNVTSNIRELEGALIKLLAYSSLKGKDINIKLAKEVLKDVISQKQRHITIDDIQKIVSEYYHIPDDLLRAKTRKKEIALARQVAMYMSKKHTKHSLKTIGLHFGGRDHSTVIHAVNTIEELSKTDADLAADLKSISNKIELSSI